MNGWPFEKERKIKVYNTGKDSFENIVFYCLKKKYCFGEKESFRLKIVREMLPIEQIEQYHILTIYMSLVLSVGSAHYTGTLSQFCSPNFKDFHMPYCG